MIEYSDIPKMTVRELCELAEKVRSAPAESKKDTPAKVAERQPLSTTSQSVCTFAIRKPDAKAFTKVAAALICGGSKCCGSESCRFRRDIFPGISVLAARQPRNIYALGAQCTTVFFGWAQGSGQGPAIQADKAENPWAERSSYFKSGRIIGPPHIICRDSC
jgi:hypothetical protein